jgi:hypothetical protein
MKKNRSGDKLDEINDPGNIEKDKPSRTRKLGQ